MKRTGKGLVKLLWTGGWDSTFRLLDLVLNHHRPVQPYYVLDRQRRSTPIELVTMDRIRGAVARSSSPDLVLPTLFFELGSIAPHHRITDAYRRLLAMGPLGQQYEWLARLAEQHGLSSLEMAIHIDDKAFAHISNFVRDDGDAMVLANLPTSNDLQLFRYYRFPILQLTKRDMEARAIECGFVDIMDMTWFCHRPDSSGRPCGLCGPCSFAIHEGMSHRIPWQGHLRRRVSYALKPIRALAHLMRDRIRNRRAAI